MAVKPKIGFILSNKRKQSLWIQSNFNSYRKTQLLVGYVLRPLGVYVISINDKAILVTTK